jgi:hypothetical protein
VVEPQASFTYFLLKPRRTCKPHAGRAFGQSCAKNNNQPNVRARWEVKRRPGIHLVQQSNGV